MTAVLDSGPMEAVAAEIRAAGLALRRAWPRGADELLLDLVGPDGAVAARWTATGGLRLHRHGADEKMPALAAMLAEPGVELLSHRPGRRAVLRTPLGYAKVVPPRKHAGLWAAARRAERLPVRTPAVVAADPVRGVVVTAALPGRSLHQVLADRGPEAVEACRAAGRLLARIHEVPVGSLPGHGPAEELAVCRRWQDWARAYGLSPAHPAPPVPVPPEPVRPVLLHRDLHDRQLLISSDGEPGVIDFDLMATGDPALDLANLLVHLELRERQGVVEAAAPLIAAVLDGYAPAAAVRRSLPFYRATAWNRLAGVYAFRDPQVPS